MSVRKLKPITPGQRLELACTEKKIWRSKQSRKDDYALYWWWS